MNPMSQIDESFLGIKSLLLL